MNAFKENIFRRFGQAYIENQNQINEKYECQLNELQKQNEQLIKRLEECEDYLELRRNLNLKIEENIRNNNRRIDNLENRSDMLEVKVKSNLKHAVVPVVHTEEIKRDVEKQEGNAYNCIDYFDFENHFRGSREAIKEVQRQYIPYFEGKTNVLDLGCGRGEFLELLKEYHIKATGVECYTEFAEYCKQKGLSVAEDDALNYLKNQKSVDGIFAGQLIEHLSVDQVVYLCELAYEKLEEGAYIVLETPNPMSLAIYTHAFYIDPSHNKPVHPFLMKYFMEKAGFREVQIIFTESSKYPVEIPKLIGENIQNIKEFNDSMKVVSETLFGSQDYAIIARKL